MIRLTKTDGGKLQDGFEHETNDCGVRALAIAANLGYTKAHELLKAEGRRDRKGTKQSWIEIALGKADIVFDKIVPGLVITGYASYRKPTLTDTIRQYSTGRYILITNRHGLALIDGIVHDAGQISGPRTQVRAIYRITLPVSKEVPVEAIISQTQINELWARLDALEAKRKTVL